MAVRLRMKRFGRANRPFWRICATDKRFARDGRNLEEVGHYDPLLGSADKIKINRERVVHWLKAGAVPSDTVAQLLAHLGLDAKGNEIPPRPWKKKKTPPPAPAAARVAAAKKKEEPAAEKKKEAPAAEKKPAEAAAEKKMTEPAAEAPKSDEAPKADEAPKERA